MINAGQLNAKILFQRSKDGINWSNYVECRGYINGLSGKEFFIANAGYEAALTVTIQCRYQPALMRVTPMQFRAVSDNVIYELISPADDVGYAHREIKFRAKRIYTEADGYGNE